MLQDYAHAVRFAANRLNGSVRRKRSASHLYARLASMFAEVQPGTEGRVATLESRHSLILKLNKTAKKARPLGRNAYTLFETLERAGLIAILDGEVRLAMPGGDHE